MRGSIVADLDLLRDVPDNIGVIPEIIGDNEIEFHVFNMSPHFCIPKKISFVYDDQRVSYSNGEKCLLTTKSKVNERRSVEIKVPKNFYQTVANKETYKGKELFEYNKLLNNDFKYQLLDDQDIINMLESDDTELSRRVKKAFTSIRAGAYKADLFRYYLLYSRGGVWLDDKTILKKPISDSFFKMDKYDGLIVRYRRTGSVEIGFMASIQYSPFHQDILYKVLENVEKRLYGEDPFAITGPNLARSVLELHRHSIDDSVLEYKGMKYHDLSVKSFLPIIRDDKEQLVWCHKPLTFSAITNLYKRDYYLRLWCKGEVYVDDNSKKPRLTSYDIDYYIVLILLGISLTILGFIFFMNKFAY